MLDFIIDLFNKEKSETRERTADKNRAIQIAACALFIEIGNIDDEFSIEEKEKVISIMKNKFSLTDSEINKLISVSKKEIEQSVSVYEFTEIVNQNFNNDEKFNLIKNLWQIAYTDGNIDKYEDHYIKRICNNLHLTHKDRIAAKLQVKEEMGIE